MRSGFRVWLRSVVAVSVVLSVLAGLGPSIAQAGAELDLAFGTQGLAVAQLSSPAGPVALAVQPDGKLLVLGGETIIRGDVVRAGLRLILARFLADGTLDPTFGTEGVVATNLGQEFRGYALVVQSDGKVVVASERLLVRCNPDGSLDTEFGSNGKLTLDPTFQARGKSVLAGQPDGKLVLGAIVQGPGVSGSDGRTRETYELRLRRYDDRGQLDASFGQSGTAATPFDNWMMLEGLIVQPDGRAVALASLYEHDSGRNRIGLFRYDVDGRLDSTFGSGGRLISTDERDIQAHRLGLLPDGRLVVVGRSAEPNSSTEPTDLYLARYQPDGSPDLTLGTAGAVVLNLAGAPWANDLAIRADGHLALLVGGDLLGVDPDRALVDRQVLAGRAGQLAFQPDGKLLVTFSGSSAQLAVRRYQVD